MKKNVYITFEGKDYTREDLTEDQINFADKLEIVTKQMNICLLYTSPSPRDKRQSRMPSSA